jgi:hypothetical protein
MAYTAALSLDHEMLQETASRLIKALGVEMAISICRSNYWHGVLQLILDREAGPGFARQSGSEAGPDLSVRLHSLPHRPVYPDRTMLDDVQEVALAA